ncbi:hypothetical protein RB195_005280 [Necator americanus]|uniref:Uncharacterized protein n=1 Tax=Necator americanus TaxID=51031 RepID=A0ABR1BQJ4_NECAM
MDMDEHCRIDRVIARDQESSGEIARQISRLLEELFKTHSRHPEFVQAVIWCMRTLIRSEPFSDDSHNTIKLGVDRLAEIFSTKPAWIQSQIVIELHRYNLPELAVLLTNAFRSPKNGVTVPIRLLLQGRPHVGSEVEMLLASYAMAAGENSAFNLGLAADGPVREARKVPLDGVKKVTMSGTHTLFLTHKGEVFACGAPKNFDSGEQNGKLVVSPIKVVFPGETLPVIDIAAGPYHSVFITTKAVYVCGINANFCLGLRKEKGYYSMTNVKLPVPEGVKKLQLEKVFTNADCTIILSTKDMWIVGKTPLNVNETFTLVTKDVGVYEMIRSNSKLLGLSYELAVVYFSTVPWVFPVNIVRVDYKNRNLSDVEVTITNSSGVLSYTFDPRPNRMLIKPCVISVNGVLVELQCVDYHITSKGDIMLMGYPGTTRIAEYYTLFRGQIRVIEDKSVDDGFTEAYVSESNVTGLRILLVLQEVPGAHAVTSFARSPDGKNLIYVTNSSTACRNMQWETVDYAKLNEERELSCLDKVDLDFHIFDVVGTRTDTLESVIRGRFPNVDRYRGEDNVLLIEKLAREVSNMKCAQIFRDYLVFGENRVINRGSTTKAMIEKICHVLGVQCIRQERFYQLGEPLNSLDKFVASRNCILVSEEGVEIKFVKELLELQSSYFGVAVTYQKNSEVPRFRLCASEKVICRALLSIINPNYLRTLKTNEIVELLSFLDQYLLYAVTADALRVLFERVNEFNLNVIFDLNESVPQLRPLIAEHFYNNLHLLAYWKNSAAASIDLVRDVFCCAEHELGGGKGIAASPTSVSCALEAPKIYILEWYRKAHWGLFRTEDAVEILLGPNNRDAVFEQAVLKYLQEYCISEGEADESSDEFSMFSFYLPDSHEPELVTATRSRLEERERAKTRRARKKSTRKSASEGVASTPPFQFVLEVRETSKVESEATQVVVNEELSTHGRNSETVTKKKETMINEESKKRCISALADSVHSFLHVKGINEKSLLRMSKQTSSFEAERIAEEDESDQPPRAMSAWKLLEGTSPSSVASPSFETQDSLTSSKKRGKGRFTPKGTKFHDASNLLHETQQDTHFAPWAGVANSPLGTSTPSMSMTLQEMEDTKHMKAKPLALKQESGCRKQRRTSGNVSWSEPILSSPSVSPQTPSLAEIMKEEERRQRESTKRISRPLQFIEDEERAIDELTQLYRENVGDEQAGQTALAARPKTAEASRISNKMAYYGNHGKGRTKNHHNNFDRDEPNGFKNPQYGPHVQLIDANWERQVTAKLDEFMNGTATELCFPPMERPERRRLHELARRKGLQTSSEGREPNRRCVVHRRPTPKLAAVGANETQPIRLTTDIRKALSDFICQYPIYGSAIDRHLAAPRSRDRSQRDIGNRERPEMLVPQRSNISMEMQKQRNMLPAYQQRADVLRAINDHKVVLITGGTGCGKTTQVPQFLLEDAYEHQQPLRIVCTQPRRLPAIAVASRVAKERGESLGSTVGYHIRLEQRTSPQTVLTYCTSGVLLRMLTQDDAARDISHIILDEIHEREQNTDYLLIALKQALKKRNDLKVILMSATMEGNLKLFTKYFGEKVEVKHIDIPSRLFTVERFFLGDVIAMTGFVPEESMFSSMFMSAGFPEVCSFPTVGDWSMKTEWETEQAQVHPRMPEAVTAPNLQSLAKNNCATPSSSNPMVSGHMITSSSVSSFTQHGKQQHTANFMNVAQQLVNSQQSSSGHQQQAPQPMSAPPQGIVHQQQQQPPIPPGYVQQPGVYVQHSAYQQGYPQPPHGYQQGQVRQVYSQPGGVALQHSATWGGGMDQSFNGVVHAHPDVVELPSEALDPETLEQFRQMGYTNNDEVGPTVTYGADWRVPESEVQHHWQHTQSFSTIPSTGYQQGHLQSWDPQVVYSTTPAPYHKNSQQQQPMFYVPESFDNSPSTKSVSYFGQSMDGFPMPMHSHHTIPQQATSGSPAAYTVPPPSHVPPPLPGYPQHVQSSGPQPPLDSYASAVQRSEKELEMMRLQLGTALPDRPESFDPHIRQLLAARRLDQSALVNMYLKCGGQQWAEAVDLDLAMAVVKYCMDSRVDGAVLVFLPGFDDIVQMRDKINNETWPLRRPVIFTLHSQMNSFDQQKVFESVGPNERKVILSTNIAEASLTIDDVVFVVDCGKVKEKTYDHTSRISQLKVTWIAKSNAEQRAGRAGRCREGYCFRLYSIEDYDEMLETQMAEMQRTAIHDVCLHAKMFAPENMTVKQFLQMAPEPPLADAVDKSMDFLEQLGALYSEASTSDIDLTGFPPPYVEPQLTDLGRLVAQLPLDPQLARLLLFGVVLRCLNPVVTLVAALSHRDPFILALSEEREQSNRQRDSFGKRDFSDHITLIRAFNEFSEKSPKEVTAFCRANYLSLPAMRMITGIRRQLLIELRRVKMINYEGDPLNALRDATYNKYSSSWPMIQAAIVAGCYPGIGFVRAGNKLKKIRTSTEAAATLHPSSVIKRQVLAAPKRSEIINQYVSEDSEDPIIEYLAFHELAKIDEGLTLRTVTVVPPCAVVLFAGSMRLKKSTIQNFNITDPDSEDEGDMDEDAPSKDVVYPIEHWIGVRATYSDMKRLIQLRFKVMSYFLSAIHRPQILANPMKEDNDLLATLAQVLQTDHQEMRFNQCVLPQQPLFYPQHQVPTSSSTSSYSSHNGQQALAQRFPHREASVSQPNMSAVVESNLKPSGGFEKRFDEEQQSSPQQEREQQDRFQDQRERRHALDDYSYQKGRRDNYDQRQQRYNRNRDDWQRNRPYQPREGAYREKMERPQSFRERDRERERGGRDETAPGPSQQQQQRQRMQGYNNRERDYRQNDREWNRCDSSGPDQLTWQQREMERSDNYRERQGRRDYNNYRPRQYNKFDDDREEPVPEDPRVDRNGEDDWEEEELQAGGYHHDQQDYQHKQNRHYHSRPYNSRGGYRGRGRGGFFNNRHYNRDDNRRDLQDDDRGDRDGRDTRDGGDNRERDHVEGNPRNNDRSYYRQAGKNYDNNRSLENDRDKHSERSRVFISKTYFQDRRRRGSNSNYN